MATKQKSGSVARKYRVVTAFVTDRRYDPHHPERNTLVLTDDEYENFPKKHHLAPLTPVEEMDERVAATGPAAPPQSSKRSTDKDVI